MTNGPADRLTTAEDLMALPDDGWKYELAHGRLVRMAPTSFIPGPIGSRVNGQIEMFLSEHPLGICCGADTGFLLSTNPDVVRAPDVAFVPGERLRATDLPRRYFPGSPGCGCE